MIPLYQFFTVLLKIWIVKNIDTGIGLENRKNPENIIKSINLLSYKDLKKLFPDAKIFGGKIFGLVQSYVIKKTNKFISIHQLLRLRTDYAITFYTYFYTPFYFNCFYNQLNLSRK